MIKIKVSTSSPNWPLIRQTPDHSGIWKNCKFYINEDMPECDYWVVYDNLQKKEKSICQKENTILITGEPVSVKSYNKKFIKQFNTVITSQTNLKHQNIINQQQSLPWMVGGKFIKETKSWGKNFSKDYNELKLTKTPKKNKLISIISSSKNGTKGHKERLDFVKQIEKEFKNDIDIYGRGIKTFEDKWDVIAPYKYHIVIENFSTKDYWTEKIADCYLAGAYPFYFGCTNISDYFSKNSFTWININNTKEAIEQVKLLIRENKYEKSIKEIEVAKNKILDEYSLFPMIHKLVNKKNKENKKTPITIFPQKPGTPSKRLLHKIKKYFSDN